MATVLVIGSGGREHALAWKLSQSERVAAVYVAPGSYAIGKLPKTRNVTLDIKNFQSVAEWCKSNGVSLLVVGPEDPLANGIADVLVSHNINVFGPRKAAAQIESDKNWAKAFMDRHQIPTARWKSFNNAQDAKTFINSADFDALVVKASGLAAGKGVVVASDKAEACNAVDSILTDKKYGAAGEIIIIEELLVGEEVSVLAFSDGRTVKAMLPAQDHKRIFDNDMGANTGGMGAYAPCPFLDAELVEYVNKHVLQAAVDGLANEGCEFIGVLYAGLILTKNGVKVLEFNARFGDPETEVLLPLLATDLYEIMHNCCIGKLSTMAIQFHDDLFAVGVVMASRGYPETSSKGQAITGLEHVENESNSVVFHCGTALAGDAIVTNGGRVLICVRMERKLHVAAAKAHMACQHIQFDGKQYRSDIAHKGFAKAILQFGNLTYKASGVDIAAGNNLVDFIKPNAKATHRAGAMGSIGGFGGLFDVKLAGYEDPLLVSGTDGVGTKLKIAQVLNKHDTIGIDLVAMCINDILAHGAEPLFFLDYFSCGRLQIAHAQAIIMGITAGCKQANCALLGGETAEMPDVYPANEYDLAGFAVGAVEKTKLLPHLDNMKSGDVVIGLPSSGLHSNGFSLVRKICSGQNVDYNAIAPFGDGKQSYGDVLITPTKIYVNDVMPVIKSGLIKAFAHITGGGLIENIPRILPKDLAVDLDADSWTIQPLFAWLAAVGGVCEAEMLRTFNCGIGGVLIADEKHANTILNLINNARIIGKVIDCKQSKQVFVANFTKNLERLMRPYIVTAPLMNKKRVAVLISGNGSNLQALIDATKDDTKYMGCEIVLVISNKADVYGLKRAKDARIKTKVINHKDYATRSEFDETVHSELIAHRVDIVCLAGFMRILTPEFTKRWRGKLLNIHPALLPAFKGVNAVGQALDCGVRVTGCTVHFVEAEVDAGAIVVQEIVPIEIGDNVQTLQDRIHRMEHIAYPKALKLVANDEVILGDDNKLIWRSK